MLTALGFLLTKGFWESVLKFLSSPAGLIVMAGVGLFVAYGYGKSVARAEARAEIQRSIEAAKQMDKGLTADQAVKGAQDRADNVEADQERERRIMDYANLVKGYKDNACLLTDADSRAIDGGVQSDSAVPGPTPPPPPGR